MGQALSYIWPEDVSVSTPVSKGATNECETPGATVVAEDPRSPLRDAPFGRTPIQLKIHQRQKFMAADSTPTRGNGSFMEIAEEDAKST